MTTPRIRVEAACAELGRAEVVLRCNELIAGGTCEPDFVVTLAGPAALGSLERQAYWLRVWGTRGLLWAGPGTDSTALRMALHDDHWRVREMACKVVARHRVDDLLDIVAALESDSIQRVRVAASRAARAIVAAGS